MAAAQVRTIRLTESDWALFDSFRQELQARLPIGRVTAADAFRAAIGSASVALANGDLPVALTKPRRQIQENEAA